MGSEMCIRDRRVGLFQVSGMYSEVQLDFRCLVDNVVIFGVTGKTGSFVYGLYIFGGRLMFQFATSLGNNNAIVTARYYLFANEKLP